jgi:hypothetical protein
LAEVYHQQIGSTSRAKSCFFRSPAPESNEHLPIWPAAGLPTPGAAT